MKVVYDNYKLI